MTNTRENQLHALEDKIGYRFGDLALLDTALTHSSYVKGDCKGGQHNERLEYLGDAVLELCVSEQLYLRNPNWNEGAMTRARAGIVCEAALNASARDLLALQEYLHLGHGEELCGGRDKPSIVSDAMEALIGAIYVDAGLDEARAFVLRAFSEALSRGHGKGKDDKTALQEYVQKRHLGKLSYRLVSATGPDHCKEFLMRVYLGDSLAGEGQGPSKQVASRQAAREAMRNIIKDAE